MIKIFNSYFTITSATLESVHLATLAVTFHNAAVAESTTAV